MNALKLFKLVVFPHLWLTFNIWPAVIGAAGSIIGGALASRGSSSSSTQDMLPWMEDSSRQFYDRLSDSQNVPGLDGFWARYKPQVYEGNRTPQTPSWLRKDYRQYANDKSGNLGASEDYYESVLAGDYLGLNPAMQQAVMNPALDQVASRFNAAGRSGYNPANIQSQNSAGMAALMPFYNAERGRQGEAAQMLPGIDDARMGRNMMRGEMQMGDRQKRIDDDIYRHDFRNNNWLERMQRFSELINPGTGYGTTTAEQPGGSMLSGALGGGLMGYNLAQNWNFGSNPGSGTGNVGAMGGGDFLGTPSTAPAMGNGYDAMTPQTGFWSGSGLTL